MARGPSYDCGCGGPSSCRKAPEEVRRDGGRIAPTDLPACATWRESSTIASGTPRSRAPACALYDQRVEKLGHLLVVLRIDGHLVDDQSADVVLDRLGHSLGIPPRPSGSAWTALFTPFHNQLHECQIVERGDPLALVGTDVGVERCRMAGSNIFMST